MIYPVRPFPLRQTVFAILRGGGIHQGSFAENTHVGATNVRKCADQKDQFGANIAKS
jgi:hypothetical protein